MATQDDKQYVKQRRVEHGEIKVESVDRDVLLKKLQKAIVWDVFVAKDVSC